MKINGREFDIPDAWREATLLEFLRDQAGLTGTKFGCGQGHCGACTVHIEGRATRSCLVPVASVDDRAITTIEGLAEEGELHPVQRAWIENSVPQCGYCQAGQIMTAAAFLDEQPQPSETEVIAAMGSNLCRCGTYTRIRAAVLRAAELRKEQDPS